MSKKALAEAIERQHTQKQEIFYLLTQWSMNGDLMSYAQYVAICGAKYTGHITEAYGAAWESLDSMNPIQLGEVYKTLKEAGLLEHPIVIG